MVGMQSRAGILSLIVHETEGNALLARTESGQIGSGAGETAARSGSGFINFMYQSG